MDDGEGRELELGLLILGSRVLFCFWFCKRLKPVAEPPSFQLALFFQLHEFFYVYVTILIPPVGFFCFGWESGNKVFREDIFAHGGRLCAGCEHNLAAGRVPTLRYYKRT